MLLHQHAAEAEACSHGGDLTGVVRLDTADRDQRVAALGQGVRREVLELPGLVAAVGKAGVAVLALGPQGDPTAEVLRQPLEPMDEGPERSSTRG